MSDADLSPLATKLNLKPSMRVVVLDAPAGLDLDVDLAGVDVVTSGDVDDAVIAFAIDDEDIDRVGPSVVGVAAKDGISWIAYPKARQLETTLTRDTLRFRFAHDGVHAIRQVAIDATWSAVRYRPA